MNKLDRIADAARKEIFADKPSITNWKDLPESAKALYRNAVIGTLKAIREPTEEIIEAGDSCQIKSGMSEMKSKDTFQAMIDAILK